MVRMWWLFVTSALMGSLFLVVGVVMAAHDRALAVTGQHTTGRIVSLEAGSGEHRDDVCPDVRFVPARGDVVVFRDGLCANFETGRVGDEVPVLYDPADPSRARIDQLWRRLMVPLMFTIVGAVFSTFGFWFLVRIWQRRRVDAWLREHGTRITARLLGAERSKITFQGETPWRLRAEWTDPADGRIHTFVSDAIWKDPTRKIGRRSEIGVLVDPANPRRHRVDVDFLG